MSYSYFRLNNYINVNIDVLHYGDQCDIMQISVYKMAGGPSWIIPNLLYKTTGYWRLHKEGGIHEQHFGTNIRAYTYVHNFNSS